MPGKFKAGHHSPEAAKLSFCLFATGDPVVARRKPLAPPLQLGGRARLRGVCWTTYQTREQRDAVREGQQTSAEYLVLHRRAALHALLTWHS